MVRTFTKNLVMKAIKSCRNSKAFGPDTLSIFHLKHLGPWAIEYITSLFNLSATTCRIPAIWKSSLIIPIPKTGKDTSQGTSYRPISLICPAAKVLESLFLPSINKYLIPAQDQHGFRREHYHLGSAAVNNRRCSWIQPEEAPRSNSLRCCRFIGGV